MSQEEVERLQAAVNAHVALWNAPGPTMAGVLWVLHTLGYRCVGEPCPQPGDAFPPPVRPAAPSPAGVVVDEVYRRLG